MQRREGELREQLINGLAALVSANTECGVKHCLTLAYDADSTKRLIFSHVFIRVLREGIKFAPQEETVAVVKQSPLCEVSMYRLYSSDVPCSVDCLACQGA